MFPSHRLIMGEQFAQENISALKIKSILNWSDTIFVNCDFSEAHFHLLMISGAIFFKCDFSGASFRACDIEASEFISSNLTCTDFRNASVSDTSYTDCIIGGLMGPQDFESCSFVYPRYSRRNAIVSPMPYVVVSTVDAPLYLFKTESGWRIHSGDKRVSVALDKVEEAQEPYRTAIAYAEQVSSDHDMRVRRSLDVGA